MTLTHGNDPDRLETIADVLRSEGERAEAARQAGAAGLAALTESWSGRDLEVFDSGWRQAERQLDACAQLLRSVGERARDQAGQQRDASGGEGGGSGAPGVPAPVAVPEGVGAGAEGPGAGGGVKFGGDAVFPDDMDDLPVPYPPDTGDPEEEPGTRLWTPQGFAMTDDGTHLVTTFYDRGDPESGMLAIQSTEDGSIKYVPLEGNDHYGGVAINGDNVYVSGNGEAGEADGSYVHRYSMRELMASPDGATPELDEADVFEVPTASTLTVHDDSLFVAKFSQGDADEDPPTVYEYRLGQDGSLPADGAEAVDQFDAPEGAQGVTTEDGENFFFTSSNGFERHSELIYLNREDEIPVVVRSDLNPVSQGIARHDGQFIITNESAAPGEYSEKVEKGDLDPDDTLQTFDVPDWPDGRPPPGYELRGFLGL